MFYTTLILVLLSFILLIRRCSNYYSIVICIQTLFLDLALVSTLIFIAKTGNYAYPNNSFFLPDYSAYLWLSKIKISFYAIIRMQNIGFAGFLACLPFFMYRPELRRRTFLLCIAVLILPFFYVYFYDPVTNLNFLAYLYKLKDSVAFLSNLKFINSMNYVWISAYFIFPLVKLLYLSIHAKRSTNRKQLFSLFFTLLCLNFICVSIFIMGSRGQTYTTLSVDNFLGFPESGSMHTYRSTYLPVMTLALSSMILIFLFRFRGLDRVDFLKNIQISRMALKPNKNVRNILHTYKNEMLSVNMIAKQLAESNDPQRQKHLIERLTVVSENALSNVIKTMDNYKNAAVVSVPCNIADCIENSINKIAFDDNTVIEKILEDNVYALCDKQRLEGVLENILRNAQEAIRIANRSSGRITVTLEYEFEWVFIKIADNGIGIEKKDINKIFNAFYSTKLSSTNWGIGLNYVFRSLKVMKGFVYVESEVNKYTTFTIVLQRIVPKTKKHKTALADKK